MDYLVTFDDGSSAFLSHHGTKGMKWGVWNEETKAKYKSAGNVPSGGGYIKEDDEDFDYEKEKATLLDAEKYGFKNTSKGRQAAYDEAGFNRKWSREKGMEVSRQNFINNLKSQGPNDTRDFFTRLFQASEHLKKDVGMANTLATRAQKQRNREYKQESSLNRMEFKGDKEGLKKAQEHTDSYYGKNGKEARRAEIDRRNKNRELSKKHKKIIF